MKRFNIYIKESQSEFLKNINELSLSEHIRRAIDQYINNINKLKDGSSSASKKI